MTEWDASSYARISGLQKAMADEVLALLTLRGDEEVLDVGCGDGKIASLIASRVPRGAVDGVDPSHEMIAFAETHFGGAMHPNLRFAVADARTLTFNEEFDLVVSFNALHWVPEQDQALSSIRRALKPDSRAQLRLVTAGTRRSLECVVEEVRMSTRWKTHFQNFADPYLRLTADQYAAAAERNGFRVLSVQTDFKTWDFKSRQAFFDFSSVGLVAWTKRLPENERPKFIDEILDRYRAIISQENAFKFYQTDISLART